MKKGTTMRNSSLLTSVCTAALCSGGVLMAQDTAEVSNDPVFLGTITLGATLDRETILEAPIAATIVSEEETELGRQDRLGDAIQSAPNVLFVDQGGPVTIRGITSLGISGGVDRQSAVGLFVDGVYIPRPFSYRQFLLDVDRVEIARGSQATLLGKNTIGGAINIITNKPDGTTGGELTFGLDDSGTATAEVAMQTPLSDTFQVRGALSYRQGDGYITNGFDGEDVHDVNDLFGRVTVTGDLATGTQIKFSADYNSDNSDGGLWYAPVDDAKDLRVDHDFVPEQEVRNGGLSFQVDHDFGDVALTSITAYREHELTFFLDGDFSTEDVLGQGQEEDQSQFSQELRLSSTGDQVFDWVVGFYYFREDFEASQSFDLTTFPRSQWSEGTFDQTNTTAAVYGKFDWEFAPSWELSAGLRYTEDSKDTETVITSRSGTFFFGPPGEASSNQTFTNLSPEISLSYSLTNEQRAYVRYARGFKSGGISPFLEADGSANVYDPETTDTIEAGYRYASSDGRFFFGATAFYTEWEDQQVFISVTPTTRVLRNAAKSVSRGFELEGWAQLTDELRMRGAYGFTDGEYEDFNDKVLGSDFSGNDLVYAPRHTVSLGLDWQRSVSPHLDVLASLDYQYQSGFSFLPDNDFEQEQTHIVDASVGLEGDAWTTKLYVNNLFDEKLLKNYFDFGGLDIGVAAPGRTVGITFSTSF